VMMMSEFSSRTSNQYICERHITTMCLAVGSDCITQPFSVGIRAVLKMRGYWYL
jgi:hypothetical protein